MKSKLIIALKKWQLIEQEVIDVQMAIDHMNAFIQALEYESYSKENCQRVAERSVGKFLYNREAFFRANTENNIAEAIAEKYLNALLNYWKSWIYWLQDKLIISRIDLVGWILN